MKLISVKFWIAHKSIKWEWKCLKSGKWSGNIIRSTVHKRNRPESSWHLTFRLRFSERCKFVFVQCAPEDTGDGNTSSAKPLQQLSSMIVNEHKQTEKLTDFCRAICFPLLSSSCWCRVFLEASYLQLGIRERTISCFEFWIRNGWFHIRAVQIKVHRTRLPFPSPVCYGPHPTSHVGVSFIPCLFFYSRHFVPRTESFAFRNRRPSGADHLSG